MNQGEKRLPPQDRDAERSVLGSMLRDNAVIIDVVQIVRADSFYTNAHQKIFQANVALYDKAIPVDAVTLASYLKDRKQLEDVGGCAYIGELWDAAPTAANAEYYARIVRDKAIVRRLIHTANEILRDAYNQTGPAQDLLESAESAFISISSAGRSSVTRFSESIHGLMDDYDERAKRSRSGISGLSTGFDELDEITAGLHQGELIVVAAATSVGKTAFGLATAVNAAYHENVPVFYATLEMTHKELTGRALSSEGQFDWHRFRRGVMNSDDFSRFFATVDRLRDIPLFYDDASGQTILRVASSARRLKAREKIGLVVVDYLQLVDSENSHTTRQEAVAAVARRLKNLATELQVPVIALSQLNRAAANQEPQLSHLLESGEIERAASVVLLLWRPDQSSNLLKVKVAKQRNGPEGVIDLKFDRQLGRFTTWFPEVG
jgi:replicative DNA helicase